VTIVKHLKKGCGTVRDTGKTCPCGSGMLYTECCGSNGKCFLLDQVRWRRAGKELRRRLGEYADQPSLCWDAAKAQDKYLGCLDDNLMLQDDDFTMERCFEWFIFDYRTHTGRTVIESFWEECGARLDHYEKLLIEQWLKARISLYEVQTVQPGKSIIMKDLLNEDNVTVHETNIASEIKTGSIVLIRVLKIGEEYEFSTSGLALPQRSKVAILTRLSADLERYFKNNPREIREWDNYLKERSHKINAWVTELGTRHPSGTGDLARLPNEQHIDAFPIKDWQMILNCFRNSGDFIITKESISQAGDLWEAVAICLGQGQGDSGLQAVRARMVLTTNSLVIIADSQKTLEIARKYYQDNLAEKNQKTEEKSPKAKIHTLSYRH